jgi:hypothetical protein
MLRRFGQCPKLGKATMPMRPTRAVSRSITSALRRCCSVSICSTTSKRGVLEDRQAFIQIELDDVHAALAHTGQHVGIVDLDAVTAAARVACR